jgi:hypothetical protein
VIALFAAAGSLLYLSLFVTFALGTNDRALYLRKARQLVWRSSPAVAA